MLAQDIYKCAMRHDNREKLCQGMILPVLCAKGYKHQELGEIIHWHKTFKKVQPGMKTQNEEIVLWHKTP